jgi:hypothetical protein
LAETLAPDLYVRETEDWDTPARRATSIEDAYRGMFRQSYLRALDPDVRL